MIDKKNIITAGITALVVALIVVGLVGGHQSVQISEDQVNTIVTQVVSQLKSSTRLGAEGDTNLTNLILSGNLTINGVVSTSSKQLFGSLFSTTQATTTPCSIGPIIATSTLDYATFNVTVATGTALTVEIGSSTNPFATSTLPFMPPSTLAASAQGSFVYNGTTTMNNILVPGTYVVAKLGAGLGGYSIGGSCQIKTTVL